MFEELLENIADKYKIDTVSFNMSETIAGIDNNSIFVIFNKIENEHITGVYILVKNSEKEMKKELENILKHGFTKQWIYKTI